MAVIHVGRTRHDRVNQLATVVDPDVRIHAEIPLITLLGLVSTQRNKSKVRPKVERCFYIIKRLFGVSQVRYHGIAKNLNRSRVTCALANLFSARKHLLRVTA